VTSDEREAELTEHLAELRTRIIWAAVAIAAGAAVCWFFYDELFALLSAPITPHLKRLGTKYLFVGIAQPFIVKLQISLVSGLVVASPFVTLQLWLFVAPGLKKEEKRPLFWMVPLSVLLFASGIALCYKILPIGVGWLLSYVPKGAEVRPDVNQALMFVVKMMLAFGLAFQLPVILVLLGKLGIVNARMLAAYWRHAMLLIAIVAAVATPSNDALTMMMLAGPLAGLYFLSIVLVRATQRRDGRREDS